MSKLRVAMATKFPYDESDAFSGLFQVSRNLCEALARRDDIDLHVVSGTSQVREVQHVQRHGYEVTYFPYPSDALHYGTFYGLASRAMQRELLRIQPDVIHCQAIAETAVGSLLTHKPLVATIHGIAAAEISTARTLRVKLAYVVQALVERWYVPRFRHVISCTPYVTQFVRRHNATAMLYDISNPMDDLFFAAPPPQSAPRPRSILIVAAISWRKGHDLLIEALSKLRESFADVSLTVIGKEVDPAFAHSIKQRIQELGLAPAVHWLGQADQTRLVQEMQHHDILILPSREDTLPMCISQAMIMGNVPVASDVGGIPFMLDQGERGFLFKRDDVADMVRVLTDVLQSPPATLDQIRHNNREYAERTYRADNVAQQTVEVYRQIVTTGRR